MYYKLVLLALLALLMSLTASLTASLSDILLQAIFVRLALLALLMSPEIKRNSCVRHGIGNYFELNY